MSLGAGELGYPDFQKVANWDGPVLAESGLNEMPYATTFPVGPYGYLNGSINVLSAYALASFEWGPTATFPKLPTMSVIKRQLILGNGEAGGLKGSSGGALLRIPNWGPYCRLRVTQVGANNTLPHVTLAGTNRVSPYETLPATTPLVVASHVFAGAGVVTVAPAFFWSGPMRVVYFSEAAGIASTVRLNGLLPPEGVETTFDFITVGSGVTVFNLYAPFTTWWLTVEAAGVNKTTSIVAQPLLSGST